MKHRIDHSLDIRRSIYPLALLKASQTFREMKTGETIEMLLSDPDTKEYLFKVLPASRCELIEIKEGKSFWRIFLRKKA